MSINSTMTVAEYEKEHAILKDLIETLQDSFNAFKECAKAAKEENFKLKCEALASKRGEMLNKLLMASGYPSVNQYTAIETADNKPTGSVTAVFHRIYIDLKALLTNGKTEAIIEEIERGETTLLDTYEETLMQLSIISRLRSLLNQQYFEVKRDLATVEATA